MSESKHTPGPWIQDGVTIRAKTPLTSIATVLDVAWPCGNVPYDPKANARLIAAAPELLEFAKEWISRQGSDNNYMTEKARAAIAKATGEPQ